MGPVAQAKPSHPIFNSELITPKTLNTQSLITLHAKRPESEVRLWRTPFGSFPQQSQSGTLPASAEVPIFASQWELAELSF